MKLLKNLNPFYIVTIGLCIPAIIYMYIKTFESPKIETQDKQIISKKQPPDIIVKNTQLDAFGFDKINGCVIDAEKSTYFKNKQIVVCENASCKITTEKNEIATLESSFVYINQKEKTLSLPQSVHGIFKDMKLKSDNAFYNSNKQTISADKLVLTSKTPNVIIKAKKSILDLKEKTIDLKDGVYSEIIP